MSSVNAAEWWPSARETWTTFTPRGELEACVGVLEGVNSAHGAPASSMSGFTTGGAGCRRRAVCRCGSRRRAPRARRGGRPGSARKRLTSARERHVAPSVAGLRRLDSPLTNARRTRTCGRAPSSARRRRSSASASDTRSPVAASSSSSVRWRAGASMSAVASCSRERALRPRRRRRGSLGGRGVATLSEHLFGDASELPERLGHALCGRRQDLTPNPAFGSTDLQVRFDAPNDYWKRTGERCDRLPRRKEGRADRARARGVGNNLMTRERGRLVTRRPRRRYRPTGGGLDRRLPRAGELGLGRSDAQHRGRAVARRRCRACRASAGARATARGGLRNARSPPRLRPLSATWSAPATGGSTS